MGLIVCVIFFLGCSNLEEPEVTDSAKSNTASNNSEMKNEIVGLDLKQMIRDLPESFPDIDYARFPGAGVQMVAPKGFVRAERFHGFRHETKSASVMVNSKPVPYESETKPTLISLGSDEQLGLKSSYVSVVNVNGREAVYVHIVQPLVTGIYGKHFLAFGNDSKSWTVTGSYLQTDESSFGEEIFKSVLSTAELVSAGQPDPTLEVDFSLTAPTLKIVPGWTKVLAYSRDGSYPLKNAADPFFIATPSVNKLVITDRDRREFALRHLRPTPDINVEEVFINRDILVGDLDGFEIVALGSEYSTNTSLIVYVAVLFEDNAYIVLQGRFGQDIAEDYLAEFREITRSIKRR